MTKDALLEIGSEELPASFIPLGMRQLKALAEASLAEHRLSFNAVQAYGTPRRLAVVISGLSDRSPDQQKKLSGPPVAVAKDASGQWTPAALGFARKQGLRPGDLTIEEGRVCAVLQIKGVSTRQLLAELFPQWMASLEFPKSMVWEPTRFRYPRPIRWIVAMVGPDLVPFSLAGVRSCRWTFGLGHSSKKVAIPSPGKYVTTLKNQCVLVEPAARQETIRKLAEQAVRRLHGQILMNEGLLEQVANLVSHPVAVLGHFDPAFLELPTEVLVTCLEHHQKFFPVAGGEQPAKLIPCFVGIRNGMSVHQEVVREGYERVLAARLADARFFYRQDRRTPLAAKVEALKGVLFQEKLGHLFDKKERVKGLIEALAEGIPSSADWKGQALRVAELCKADLVTDMVREFPELQGVVARLYAQADGEEATVARGLEEQYWPITLSGRLPGSAPAAAAALADKLDTLAGDFAVGLIPSGSADPYGLRRAAVGVLRILEAQGWPLRLEDLLQRAIDRQPAAAGAGPETLQKLLVFMTQRLSALLEERGFRGDEIDAVLAAGIGALPETLSRLQALHDFRQQAEFEALAGSFKRVANIVRQAREKQIALTDGDRPQAERLQEPSEQELWRQVSEIESRLGDAPDFAARLRLLVPLREPLARFFEEVMVMAEDPELRLNRLRLLNQIAGLFRGLADFSRLQNVGSL